MICSEVLDGGRRRDATMRLVMVVVARLLIEAPVHIWSSSGLARLAPNRGKANPTNAGRQTFDSSIQRLAAAR